MRRLVHCCLLSLASELFLSTAGFSSQPVLTLKKRFHFSIQSNPLTFPYRSSIIPAMKSPLINNTFYLVSCIKSLQTDSVRELLQMAHMYENPHKRSVLCVRCSNPECSFGRAVEISGHDVFKLLLVNTTKAVRLQTSVELRKRDFLKGVSLEFFQSTENDTSTDSMLRKEKNILRNPIKINKTMHYFFNSSTSLRSAAHRKIQIVKTNVVLLKLIYFLV